VSKTMKNLHLRKTSAIKKGKTTRYRGCKNI
jgi:hypothetical protein